MKDWKIGDMSLSTSYGNWCSGQGVPQGAHLGLFVLKPSTKISWHSREYYNSSENKRNNNADANYNQETSNIISDFDAQNNNN